MTYIKLQINKNKLHKKGIYKKEKPDIKSEKRIKRKMFIYFLQNILIL